MVGNEIEVFFSVPELIVFEGVVLGEHPEAGTEDLDVLFFLNIDGEFTLFGDKGEALDADDIASSKFELLFGLGVFHGDL